MSEESSASLFAPELEWLASLSQQEFSEVFRNSSVKRAKWRGLLRNACVALGNSRVDCDSPAYPRIIRLLEQLSHLPKTRSSPNMRAGHSLSCETRAKKRTPTGPMAAQFPISRLTMSYEHSRMTNRNSFPTGY